MSHMWPFSSCITVGQSTCSGQDTAHAHTSAESSGRLKAALHDAISMVIKKKTPSAQINAQISSAAEAKWGSGSTSRCLARHETSCLMMSPFLFTTHSPRSSLQRPSFNEVLGLRNPQHRQIKTLEREQMRSNQCSN